MTPVAMHCDALLARRAPERDHLASFTRFAEALAPGFARHLAAMEGGQTPQVAISSAQIVSTTALEDMIAPLAGNLLFPMGTQRANLLASFAAAPLLDYIDRMFGGSGATEELSGKTLPKSIELLVRRLEAALHSLLAAYLNCGDSHDVGRARLDASLRSLAPFPAGTELAVITLTFTGRDAMPIELHLACRVTAVPGLLSQFSSAGSLRQSERHEIDAPFTDIPLPLSATLVDMMMPVRKLAHLEVGSVLPVAVARKVPLHSAEHIVAYGTVGELDERVALKIEQSLITGETR